MLKKVKIKKLLSLFFFLTLILVVAAGVYNSRLQEKTTETKTAVLTKETRAFDFSGTIKVELKHEILVIKSDIVSDEIEDVIPEEKMEITKSIFDYNIEGSVMTNDDYYLKISDSKNQFYDFSSIDGKKYTRLLHSGMISESGEKYGLGSTNFWKELEPRYLIDEKKIDKYNISLMFSGVKYIVDSENIKLGSDGSELQYFSEEIDSVANNYPILDLLDAISYKKIDSLEMKREVWVDGKSGFWNNEKINIVAFDVDGEEVISMEAEFKFSDFGKEIDLPSVTKIDDVITNENLRDSIRSVNDIDLKNKRSLYLVVKGLQRYYSMNSEYPRQNLSIIDEENSSLLDLVPVYFLKNNLLTVR